MSEVTSYSASRSRQGRATLRRLLGVMMGALVAYAAWGGPKAPEPELPRRRDARARERAPSVQSALAPAPSAAGNRGPSAEPSAQPGQVDRACPAEMVLVEGEYCTAVEHTCKIWLDDATLPFARCGQYQSPARCIGTRRPLRFCMDRYEYTPPGETLPQNHASFVEASAVCERLGKRVCTEDEWNFACEGPDMLPYPYGWSREPVCNQDRSDLYEPNPNRQILRDNRVTSGALPGCRSPFGVYDMAGNLDEPVLRESQRHAYPYRNALKGGWWMAARNRCRPATTAHGDHYRDIQIGIRCCGTALTAISKEREAADNLD